MPRVLTDGNKAGRMMACLLQWYTVERKPLCWVIAGDETGIHHFTHTSKQSTMEWKHPSSPRTPSTSTVLGIVFWDSLDVWLIDFLGRGCTVNADT
jgi:hypothetical protein